MIWAIPMLLARALFTGGVVSIAWELIPAWRDAELQSSNVLSAQLLLAIPGGWRLNPGAEAFNAYQRTI
jgi:hypothetical protein